MNANQSPRFRHGNLLHHLFEAACGLGEFIMAGRPKQLADPGEHALGALGRLHQMDINLLAWIIRHRLALP